MHRGFARHSVNGDVALDTPLPSIQRNYVASLGQRCIFCTTLSSNIRNTQRGPSEAEGFVSRPPFRYNAVSRVTRSTVMLPSMQRDFARHSVNSDVALDTPRLRASLGQRFIDRLDCLFRILKKTQRGPSEAEGFVSRPPFLYTATASRHSVNCDVALDTPRLRASLGQLCIMFIQLVVILENTKGAECLEEYQS
jgi:hypothetical protein